MLLKKRVRVLFKRVPLQGYYEEFNVGVATDD